MDISQRIGIDRLGLVAAPEGDARPEVTTAVLAELAHVGVRIANPEAMTDGLALSYKDVIAHVRERRGQKRTYSPLFRGFPEQLPELDDAALRFLLAAVRLLASEEPLEAGDLSDEAVRRAMDFSSIGWWPASSVPQDVDRTRLDRSVQELLPQDSRVEWWTLRAVTPAELEAALRRYMQECFASASSLRDDVKADLDALVSRYGISGIDPGEVRFRENRTLLLKLVWNNERGRLPEMAPTPDDLLRLFAELTGSNASLAEKIRYPKLTRADRRIVVAALESSARLGDIFRRRGLWLAIDRGLHLGEFDALKTKEAFARLRESRHDASSFGSRFERALAGDYTSALTMAADEAPGVLVRSLRRLMALSRSEGEQLALIAALGKAAPRVPLRVLLAAWVQVNDNGRTYPRAAFTKSGAAKFLPYQPGHLSVADELSGPVVDTLRDAMAAQVRERGSWAGEKVYIAPELEAILVPDQLRTTAQGTVQVERGSRLPLGEAAVVRLFVHWKESAHRSDLDLSMLALDEHYNLVDQVSWTNLGNGVMTHSGDITSAPDGAEEFLDVNLERLRTSPFAASWRYLVPAVLRYAGESFDELAEACVGWMLRDRASSGHKVFDVATVANAFELTGCRRLAVPMLVDLETNQVVYVDVYLDGAPGARLERDGRDITTMARAAADRIKLKASVAMLAHLHATERGAVIVNDRAEATVTFGLSDEDTYNALRPERLLAELL